MNPASNDAAVSMFTLKFRTVGFPSTESKPVYQAGPSRKQTAIATRSLIMRVGLPRAPVPP